MLALFASIYEPHVYGFAVRVHPELAGVNELLLFPTASATMIDPNVCRFSGIQCITPRQVFDREGSFECSSSFLYMVYRLIDRLRIAESSPIILWAESPLP